MLSGISAAKRNVPLDHTQSHDSKQRITTILLLTSKATSTSAPALFWNEMSLRSTQLSSTLQQQRLCLWTRNSAFSWNVPSLP